MENQPFHPLSHPPNLGADLAQTFQNGEVGIERVSKLVKILRTFTEWIAHPQRMRRQRYFRKSLSCVR